jgi:hypothetical protein
MASQDPNSRLPISLFLSRITCVLLEIAAIAVGIALGILPPRFVDEWWGPQYPQLPSLSIASVCHISPTQIHFLILFQFAVILVLDTEEVVRLLIRHIKKRQTWKSYPDFIIACDLLLGLAVFLAVVVWLGAKTTGHRTNEFRQLEQPHIWLGVTCV